MFKSRHLLAAALLLLALPASAADNWSAQTPSGSVVFRSFDTGSGIESPQVTPQDANNVKLISCNAHVFKHITSATDTLAVQGVSAKTIYVCGYKAAFAGTNVVFLENTASVNANCASALTQIAGADSGLAQSVMGFIAAYYTGLSNTAANGLCINSTGTGAVDVDIWYAQF